VSTLDTRPESVDVLAYAGDTLELTVVAPGSLVTGKTWKADVKATTDAVAIDASWDITPPVANGGPAFITLDSATTRLLASMGTQTRAKNRAGKVVDVIRYTGVFDVQISLAGSDPVRTLLKGTLAIDQDVTL
jgi:hypothetical protein